MAEYTPGPWTFRHLPPGLLRVETRGGEFIAHLYSDTPNAMANARLIAAAPRLLWVLKELLEVLDELFDHPDVGDALDAIPCDLGEWLDDVIGDAKIIVAEAGGR